mmetsp:Transcript_47336/g.94903  ORF Transcript_47336/g.94903 Transcript_47336/m.94903 type:complete len:124 (+) Transcript_47336:73-444(+)
MSFQQTELSFAYPMADEEIPIAVAVAVDKNKSDTPENGGGKDEIDSREMRKSARREYHKCIERKRRDRMRALYEELRVLTQLAEPTDKNAVLADAIKLIQTLKAETSMLEQQVFLKKKQRRFG